MAIRKNDLGFIWLARYWVARLLLTAGLRALPPSDYKTALLKRMLELKAKVEIQAASKAGEGSP